MTSSVNFLPTMVQIARGADFPKTWKTLLDMTVQFGANGQELRDNVSRKPVAPARFISINPDGTMVSKYALREDRHDLSPFGQEDYKFDRDKAEAALKKWETNGSALLQVMINALSPESKAMLELKIGPTGYHALVLAEDTLGLGKLITETHLGLSTRSKQFSFQQFLQWKTSNQHFPTDLANFRLLLDTVTLNFQSEDYPGCFKIEVLARMVFLLGLDRTRFQREIENAYDQNLSKTTVELMELCQMADMERGLSGASATFTPAALPAVLVVSPPLVSPSKPKRPSLGPYNNKLATCPHCWNNGYRSNNHGVDHKNPARRDCFHQTRAEAYKLAHPVRPPVPPSQALVTASGPMTVAAAHAFVAAYTTDGFQQYVTACKVAGITVPDLVQTTETTALVSPFDIPPPHIRTDAELALLRRLAQRSVSGPPVVVIPSPDAPPRVLRQTSLHHFFGPILAASLDDSFSSMSVQDDTFAMDPSFVSADDDPTSHILHLHQVNSAVQAPPTMFSLSAHHTGVARALAIADDLAQRVEVQAGLDIAPNYSFGPSDADSTDSDDLAPIGFATTTNSPGGPSVALRMSEDFSDVVLVAPSVSSGIHAPVMSVFPVPIVDDGSYDLPIASLRAARMGRASLPLPCMCSPPRLWDGPSGRCFCSPTQVWHGPSGRCFSSAILFPDDGDEVPALVSDESDDDFTADIPEAAFAADVPELVSDDSDDTDEDDSPVAPVFSTFALVSAAPPASKLSFHWDSGCSVNVTHDLSLLVNVHQLPSALLLGGVGAGVWMTHVGDLAFLAAWPDVSVCYYAPNATHNLLSLGAWQRQGFVYASTSLSTTTIWDPAGVVVDVGVVLPHNLLQASFPCASPVPSLPSDPYASVASYTALVSNWARFREQEAVLPEVDCQPDEERFQLWFNSAPTACVMSYDERLHHHNTSHFNAEQRARFDRVEAFHHGRGVHFSDDVFAEALHNGLLPELNLTPRDVRDNRRMRGPCPNCVASKFKQQSMPPSLSEPASLVAEHLHIDIFEKTKKSPGGKSVAIRMSDDFSGDVQFGGSISKSTAHLMTAIVAMIHKRYTVHGHRVRLITADSDPALEPIIPLLQQQMQITMSLVSPGMHEHFIENRVGSHSGKVRAVLNSMSYILPAQFEFHAEKWVYDNANALPNSRSRPSTPDILVTGRRRKVHLDPDVAFGSTAIVFQSDQKRVALAKDLVTSVKMVNAGQAGICVGFSDDVPGDYLFLLDNGHMVPRRNIHVVSLQPTLFGKDLPLRNVLRSVPLPPPVYPDFAPVDDRNEQLYHPLPDVPASLSPPVSPGALDPSMVLPDDPALAAYKFPVVAPQTPLQPHAPVFNIHSLVDVSGSPIFRSPASPVRSPSLSLVPQTLLPDFSPTPVPSIAPRRSARIAQTASGLLARLPASLVHVSRRSLTVPTPKAAAMVAKQMADALDNLALDEAILDSQQQFRAMVATATELLPFSIGPDEYLAQESTSSVATALLSSFDKIPHTELQPIRDLTAKQLSLSLALRSQPRAKLERVITAELDKLIRIGGIHPDFYPDRRSLPSHVTNDQIVAGIFVFKDKSDGRETARLAADGRKVDLPDGQISYAEVVPGDDKQMALAGMVAHCNSRNELMNMSTSDVVGAFPRVARPPGSVDLYLLLPHNLPHPWAGGYVQIKGALYGLKESSRLFQLELVKVILSAGYRAMPESRMTFVAHHPKDPGLMAVASVVVDDVRNLDNCPSLTIKLQASIRARFSEITIDDGTMFAGIEHVLTHSDGVSAPRNTVVNTQNKYIGRIAANAGTTHMPPVPALDMPDFYEASTTPTDLVPADLLLYPHFLGCLTHALQTRAEIRPAVSYLASRNVTPTAGDMAKAIYVLRYLSSTPQVGLVYNARSTQLCAYSDSAFACHEDGKSSTGFILCMGPDDAPFVCSAKAQPSVAPDIVSSEYYAAGAACLLIAHFRQLATSIGWVQGPTQLFMDSQSAIKLAQAPTVTKKARHMRATHHYIREMVALAEVTLVHVPTAKMRVDVLTKVMTSSQFLRGRASLMNSFTVLAQGLCGYVSSLWFS